MTYVKCVKLEGGFSERMIDSLQLVLII